MAYRKVLVPLTGGARDACTLKAAFEVAAAFGGHVAGVFVKPDPTSMVAFLGENVSGTIIQQIADETEVAAKRAAATAQGALRQAAQTAGATVQPPSAAAAGLSASFHVREGLAEDIIADEARLSDLCVFDAPWESEEPAMRAVLESALLNGRKPVLVSPRQSPKIVQARIAVGWDGGPSAAHAVSAAIPLMKGAESIEIISVGHWPVDTTQMDRLRDYLRLHGLQPTEHAIHTGNEETGATLLDAAQRLGAGLLVIGGYGHNRLREVVLGGVTRYVLANTTMPVFMAH